MSIEEVLFRLLSENINVRSLVGSRIYPSQAPESAEFPQIVYQEADRKTVMTMDGPVDSDEYTIDLECSGTSYASSKVVGKAVRNYLNGYRGQSQGLRILGVFDVTESDQHDLPQHGDERGIFTVSMTLRLWFRPA